MHVGRFSVTSVSWWVSILSHLYVSCISVAHKYTGKFDWHFLFILCLFYTYWKSHTFSKCGTEVFVTVNKMYNIAVYVCLQYCMSWSWRWQHVVVDSNEQGASGSIYVGMCHLPVTSSCFDFGFCWHEFVCNNLFAIMLKIMSTESVQYARNLKCVYLMHWMQLSVMHIAP